MDDTTNGSLKGPKGKGKGMNGLTNGLKSSPNGHHHTAVAPRRRTTQKPGPGFVSRIFSIVARLLTWYSIFSILFRCPATIDECTADTPRICKPYFQIKQAVSPHLEPYYDAYAAPYVELARPYYNTVDQKVLTPTWGYATKYGAPRVAQAQAFGQAQWEKNVQPQLAKYQALAKTQYDEKLGPHVDQLSSAVGPYYDIARTNALQTYHELLLPSYQFVEPYAHKGYIVASAFAMDTALPSAAWAWNKTYVFLNGTVWPQLRVVYTENVEPQLVKIGQRLGRYNSSNAQKAPVESLSSTASKAVSSFTKPTASASSSSSLPASSDAITSESEATSSEPAPPSSGAPEPTGDAARARLSGEPVVAPPPDEKGESDMRRTTRETVAEDLKAWQEKYAKAADDGAAEIEERVDEIAKRMVRRHAKTMGKSVIEELQQAVVAELVTLRRDIINIVGAVAKGSATPDEALEQVTTVVRRAGSEIKGKAQDVRIWRENYEVELQAAITKAAENHFKILGSIRDLALQKIGMKWAWMDGITYKDWAKYHELRGRFDEWEVDLKNLIVTHPSLLAAQAEGQAIEDKGMELAQSAAQELGRLKQVALYKIAAKDDSDEFDSEITRLAAEAIENAKEEVEDVSSSVVDEAESARDAASTVASSIVDEAESATEAATAVASSILSEVVDAPSSISESVASGVSEASSSIADASPASSLESLASKAGSQLSSASESAASMVKEASSSVLPSSDSQHDEKSSSSIPEPGSEEEESTATDLAAEASTIVLDETPVVAGNTTEFTEPAGPGPAHMPVDELAEPADSELSAPQIPPASSATSSIKSAFLGAAAQSVPSRKPILDDDTFDSANSIIESLRSDVPSSIASVASSAYSAAMSNAAEQYSHALSAVSVQISGTPKPAHEEMLSSVSAAYSQAVETASARLDGALKIAHDGIFGTTTKEPLSMPTLVDWARVESIASERLNDGRAWAEQQYENARIAVGLATPTPTDFSGSVSSMASVAGESVSSATAVVGENAEKILENARHNYYAGLGVAHARYSEFMAAASSAFSSLTATPTPTDFAGTASSIASVASESAASAASVAGENIAAARDSASSMASVVGDTVASAASLAGDTVNSAAAAGYEGAAAGYENVASAAGAAGDYIHDSWDSVLHQISSQVYGAPTPTPWYESFYSAAEEYAASATGAFGDGASSVTSAAGTYAAAASDEASKQYEAISSLVSELLVGKEPTFSESVYSKLNGAYSTVLASASSVAAAASSGASSVGDNIGSAAAEATEAVKESVEHLRDEL